MSSIGHIWIPVSDLDRSVAFYTDKLGLEKEMVLRPEDDDMKKLGLDVPIAKLISKDQNIVLILVAQPSLVSPTPGMIPGFQVQGLDQVISAWKEKGVEFYGDVISLDDRRLIHFRDPDGNVFHVSELVSDDSLS